MSLHELAQLNVAQAQAPLDTPPMKDFVDNLERINALADGASGFVWRLQTEDGDATALRPFGDDMLVNISVWRDFPALHDYVYRTAHAEIMARRHEWFERMREMYVVLWWVPAGHRPDVDEAAARLQQLREHGPGPEAFTFKKSWPAPDAMQGTKKW